MAAPAIFIKVFLALGEKRAYIRSCRPPFLALPAIFTYARRKSENFAVASWRDSG
jgi:hypothetical protein